MTKAVPAVTPFAIPEEDPIVATEGFELDHVPPAGDELSVDDAPPVQRPSVPVIAFAVFTVTTIVAL